MESVGSILLFVCVCMSVVLFGLDTNGIVFLLVLVMLVVLFVGALAVVVLTLYGRLAYHRRHVRRMLHHQQFVDLPSSGSVFRDVWYQYLRRVHRHWKALRLDPHDPRFDDPRAHDHHDKHIT